MKIIIHRGSNQIGGTCVELESNNGSRIIIDLGLPLDTPEEFKEEIQNKTITKETLLKTKILPKIKGLYIDDKPEVKAIFISHYHQDHYGLLSFVHPDIPIYMSSGTKEMIACSHFFEQTPFNPEKAITFKAWDDIKAIEDFTIKPHLVDHSALDAFSFEITCDNKKVFHSGDLRAHGRKSILFTNMLKRPPNNIDYLILEGTTLGRPENDQKFKTRKLLTENDVEKALVEHLKQNKTLNMISCSSQNFDRLVSIYRACKKTGKTLVIDPYTAYTLERAISTGLSFSLPQFNWDNVRVFYPKSKNTFLLKEKNKKYAYKRITIEEMIAKKDSLVVKYAFGTFKKLNKFNTLAGSTMIYSQWSGYLKEFKNDWLSAGMNIISIHVSGHAYPDDLKKIVQRINPDKVIPIHTEHQEQYKELFKKVLILKDGEEKIL